MAEERRGGEFDGVLRAGCDDRGEKNVRVAVKVSDCSQVINQPTGSVLSRDGDFFRLIGGSKSPRKRNAWQLRYVPQEI